MRLVQYTARERRMRVFVRTHIDWFYRQIAMEDFDSYGGLLDGQVRDERKKYHIR